MIQHAQVAGLFYPADPTELSSDIDHFLKNAKAFKKLPRAIIAPHASYLYSGKIMANAYAALSEAQIESVVLLAPAHKLPFMGMATLNADAYRTPLGDLKINKKLTHQAEQHDAVQALDLAFHEEHTLEVHLPFLQTLLPEASLLPVIVGNCEPKQVDDLLTELALDHKTLIVMSSDLSHYQAYSVAREMDQQTSRNITQLKANHLSCDDACGFVGINALLLYATRQNWQAQCIDLRNSGDITGETERVVGYGAFHFLERR